MDELSQLDELIESDILEALGENVSEDTTSNDEINIEDFDELEKETSEEEIILEDLDEEINSSEEINIQDTELSNIEIENNSQVSTDNLQKIQY